MYRNIEDKYLFLLLMPYKELLFINNMKKREKGGNKTELHLSSHQDNGRNNPPLTK